MDIRSLWLPDHSVQALKMIARTGPLPLAALHVDELMSLGGHGLIALTPDSAVATTRQGARFLSVAEAREKAGASAH